MLKRIDELDDEYLREALEPWRKEVEGVNVSGPRIRIAWKSRAKWGTWGSRLHDEMLKFGYWEVGHSANGRVMRG